jgi:two-component sensor histidine kinase
MADPLWASGAPPRTGAGAALLGRWELTTLAELTAGRRQLAAVLDGAGGTDGAAAERLLLAFEELGSNALRHGRPPVRVTVTAVPGGWLLEASDGAADVAPEPAVGRDAALGGLGLHLVAGIVDEHGWVADGTAKTAGVRIRADRA